MTAIGGCGGRDRNSGDDAGSETTTVWIVNSWASIIVITRSRSSVPGHRDGDHCLRKSREKFNAEPESITVEERAAQAVRAMTDGGEDIVTDDGRDRRETALKANEISCSLTISMGLTAISRRSAPCVSSFRTASYARGTGRNGGKRNGLWPRPRLRSNGIWTDVGTVPVNGV